MPAKDELWFPVVHRHSLIFHRNCVQPFEFTNLFMVPLDGPVWLASFNDGNVLERMLQKIHFNWKP